MTREEIQTRIEALRAALKQVEAQGNGIVGAIAENERWLKTLEQPEKKE